MQAMKQIKCSTDKVFISFSGGRSSAVMADLVLRLMPEKEILIAFANTGLEHEETLRFVNYCEKKLFKRKVFWLEAVINFEDKKGVTHRFVDFESASRKGEPYREAVKKYGLFNQTNPSCTARLKIDVIEHFLKTKNFVRGKKLNYSTAIGIRADEIDRVSVSKDKNKFIYPLADLGITKQEVKEICASWDFDLKIPEHYGNCVGCWKKSFRKLATIAKELPENFEFWREIEDDYKSLKNENNFDPETGYRRIYRQNKTVDDIFQIANSPGFVPFTELKDTQNRFDFMELDIAGSCGESCEIYADNE